MEGFESTRFQSFHLIRPQRACSISALGSNGYILPENPQGSSKQFHPVRKYTTADSTQLCSIRFVLLLTHIPLYKLGNGGTAYRTCGSSKFIFRLRIAGRLVAAHELLMIVVRENEFAACQKNQWTGVLLVSNSVSCNGCDQDTDTNRRVSRSRGKGRAMGGRPMHSRGKAKTSHQSVAGGPVGRVTTWLPLSKTIALCQRRPRFVQFASTFFNLSGRRYQLRS